MNYHKLLEKQIRRYLPLSLQHHIELQKMLAVISESYFAGDRDREIAERAFSISEQEYAEVNSKLKKEVAVKKQSLEKLKTTIATFTGQEDSTDSDDLLMLTRYLDQQVNERKQAEERLKSSQDLWHFALEGSGDGVWEYDTVSKKLFFSKQFKRMLGYDEDEFKNSRKEWLKRVHPADRPAVIKTGKDYINKRIKAHQNEYRILHKNGSYIWVLDRGQMFKAGEESNERIIGTNTDITERKKTEEEYKRISVVASANENGVVFTNNAGCITWTNEGFMNLTGYSRNEIIGKTPFDLCKGPMSDRMVMRQMVNDFENGNSFNSELIHYRKDGSWFWGRSRGQCVTDEHGKIIEYFAIIEDITKEKASQKKLKEYEERLKTALSIVGDNYWEHNFKTGKTYFANAGGKMLGYETEAFANGGKFWLQIVHLADRMILEENDKKYRSGIIDNHTNEYRVTHRDGSVHWLLDRGVVTEKDENGKPLRIIGTHIDITKQKELETELSRRVHQFKSLSENIPGVIYEYELRPDGSEGLLYVSPAMKDIFGISPEAFYKFGEFIHPADACDILTKRYQSLNLLHPYYAEARLITPSGMVWYSDTASFSYYTPEGSTVFTGFMQNITERKNAENALKVNEEKYRNIIANMNLGLLEVDTNEVIRFANQSFCDMSGYTLEELKGCRAADLFVKQADVQMMEMKNESRKKGISDAYEIPVKNKDGVLKWWLISGAPKYNDKGELVGSIGIHLDITTQKLQEYELLEAREQAESSANAKQLFLANMSHEIRTPMNAILGMTRQLQKTTLDDTQKFYLDTVNNAGEHLMVIINDILDISKIEAGKLVLESIPFSIREVMKHTVDVMQHRASEKGILINYNCEEKIAPVLAGDPYRLKQVLLNLVSNSVKFSEQGTVMIDCSLTRQNNHTQQVCIKVSDTGIGMDKEYLDNLFQSFTQEDRSVSRKYGGTGLGMTITKQLTELMGGTVDVMSEKNVGTTIILSIPFGIGDETDLVAEKTTTCDPSLLKGKKILLVEDNEINRLIARITLDQYGAEITEAVNGLEAVEMLRSQTFHLVLMDMQMPVMDGLEATRAIRNELGSNVVIIALTANAIKGESDKCFAAGMNDFVTKPFEESELINTIAKWLNMNVQASPQKENIEEAGTYYDISRVNELCRGNQVLVKKIIQLFVSQAESAVEEFTLAHAQQNFPVIQALAHKMKSSCDNLGAYELKNILAEIERLAKTNTSSVQLDNSLRMAVQQLQQIIFTARNNGNQLHIQPQSAA